VEQLGFRGVTRPRIFIKPDQKIDEKQKLGAELWKVSNSLWVWDFLLKKIWERGGSGLGCGGSETTPCPQGVKHSRGKAGCGMGRKRGQTGNSFGVGWSSTGRGVDPPSKGQRAWGLQKPGHSRRSKRGTPAASGKEKKFGECFFHSSKQEAGMVCYDRKTKTVYKRNYG